MSTRLQENWLCSFWLKGGRHEVVLGVLGEVCAKLLFFGPIMEPMIVRILLVAALSLAASAQDPAARPYWRTIVRGTHGMVAAEHPLEAMAGLEALKAGGNAIDAALAVYYMTSEAEQHQSGLGSDCFVLAYIAKQRKVAFFNATGPAPKLATLETYRKLCEIPRTAH